MDRAVVLTQRLDKESLREMEKRGRKNPGSVKAFLEFLGDGAEVAEVVQLRREVEEWIGTFRLPWIKEGGGG